ncbi:hypothetical protein ASE63_15665 [Bosea sp. Root381]|uniref:hypothetical protein n=1 Tax=Bosea sp. Root381 TaxID=1736524 RepID=UPI0006F3EAE7|nr:hypothetical protein [Bosea sp. Root381]KRE15691.1 hypothetical protein ASE63_15665 [Bosea sp. Root381]
MLTGNGTITLRSGRALAAQYQFHTHRTGLWTGYLICDSSTTDPSEFADKVLLFCADGAAVELAVTSWTDHDMAVVGRELPVLDRVG